MLEKCLVARADMGYPCNKTELKELVQEYLNDVKQETRFPKNLPGDGSYQDL